jgi:hypothetical protein
MKTDPRAVRLRLKSIASHQHHETKLILTGSAFDESIQCSQQLKKLLASTHSKTPPRLMPEAFGIWG